MYFLQQLIKVFVKVFRRIRKLVRDNSEPITEFTQVGLYELMLTLQEFRSLVSSLNQVAKDLERDPARFLFGDPQAGYTIEKR